MEPNFERTPSSMGALPVQVDDSVKSRILERIKAQIEQETSEPRPVGWPIPPIYLKAPDDWA